MSIRDQILSATDIRKEQVKIDAWGVTVEVRTLTGAQRSEAKRAALDPDGVDEAKLSAGLIIAGTFDPTTGNPVFTAADRDALMGKSAVALDQVVAALGRLSGVTVEEQKEIEKNSEATPSDVSTSA